MFPEMEIATTPNTTTVKTPEAENETPPSRIQTAKNAFSGGGGFSNGVLKRHMPLHVNHGGGAFNYSPPRVVTYKECLKNHAATLGGHAVDGCGEFMPSPTSTPTDPTSLKCAACGCHRNFHRRDPEELPHAPTPTTLTTPALEYQPHHRHHPPPPTSTAAPPANNHNSGGHSSPSSPSPPPISSSYYPSAPHMLLALSAGLTAPATATENNNSSIPITPTAANPTGLPGNNSNSSSGRKRFRTKFTADQKQKMHEFADRIGWKIQKRDEELIENFCNSINVDKSVLKVWMHNNKHNFGKRDHHPHSTSNTTPISGAGSIPPTSATSDHGNGNGHGYSIHHYHNNNNSNMDNSDESKNGIRGHPHELSHHHHQQIHHHGESGGLVTNGNGNASSCSS